MNALELLNSGSHKLQRQKIRTSRLDSEILLSTVLRMKREKILTNLNQKIKPFEINKFKNEDLDFIIIIQVTFTDSSTLLKIASCLGVFEEYFLKK